MANESEWQHMPFHLRLMFEWGGGSLWCENEFARREFGLGPIEKILPISEDIRSRIFELSKWHDTALNWDYPLDPSPWSAEEKARFESAANSILGELQTQLGGGFVVSYQPL